METLRRMVTYNGWANARVFEVCSGLDSAALEQQAAGSVGTLAEALRHLVTTEDAYLTMLSGRDIRAQGGSRAEYQAQPISWFLERLRTLRPEYDAMVAADREEGLERALDIPWFAKPLSARDSYIQILAHSAHHRAQIFSVLGDRGIQVPDLDYVIMVQEQSA